MRNKTIILLLILTLPFLSGCNILASIGISGKVSGKVTIVDSTDYSDVFIYYWNPNNRIIDEGITTQPDSEGNFVLDIPLGSQNIAVYKEGYGGEYCDANSEPLYYIIRPYSLVDVEIKLWSTKVLNENILMYPYVELRSRSAFLFDEYGYDFSDGNVVTENSTADFTTWGKSVGIQASWICIGKKDTETIFLAGDYSVSFSTVKTAPESGYVENYSVNFGSIHIIKTQDNKYAKIKLYYVTYNANPSYEDSITGFIYCYQSDGSTDFDY